MSDYIISEKCIDNFLEKFHIIMRFIIEKDEYGDIGDIRLYLRDNPRQFGHLHYGYDKKNKELNISTVYIRNFEGKERLPIKLLHITLLRLIGKYDQKAKFITLTANPSKGGNKYKNTEFCLLCMYERLGFKYINLDICKAVKKCKKDIIKREEYREEYDSCILCKCQKLNIPLEADIINRGSRVEYLGMMSVDMKTVIPKIKDILNEIYKQVCSY